MSCARPGVAAFPAGGKVLAVWEVETRDLEDVWLMCVYSYSTIGYV